MKKIFILIGLILGISSNAFAFENYLLMSDHDISKIKISNEEIITVETMNNLCSDKKRSMVIIPHKEGCTRLSFKKGKHKINLVVRVCENRTCIKKVNGIKMIPIDLPPELKG